MTASEQNMICIVCPRGCRLIVRRKASCGSSADGLPPVGGPGGSAADSLAERIEVTGNACPRGAAYARQELTDPRRQISSTVRVLNGQLTMLPVKTDRPIPKASIFDVMRAINRVERAAPIRAGEVILENVAGTGCNIVACRRVDRLETS